MKQTVHQLVHGYQKGHSLLASSCSLPKSALEIVTEQSDLSGPLPAGVSVPSHLTAYPIPDTAFYALGRTWPDTDASRSGCVITHTLLIPMNAWGAAENPAAYLRLHKRPDKRSLETFKQGLSLPNSIGEQPRLSWLNAAEADEFAAKVFSEGLRSIIWFDCEAPDLLVMTLASLLWPSLRGSLYAHTFSLHAHAKVKSDLQLHFAPRSAQSYFNRVPKQCHMSKRLPGNRSESVQEWICELSEDLRAGGPRVSYLDGLKQYGHLLGRESSAVRNLFALRDLTERLPNTPTAAVGILDIIDSLEPVSDRALTEKQNALDAAVSEALKADAPATLRCLSLIDTRLRRLSFAGAGSHAQSVLKDSVEKIVAKEPQTLIAACGQSLPSDDSVFWQAAVNGMRTAAETRPNSLQYLGRSPTIASYVVREAPSVARAYLHSNQDRRAEAISEVIMWVRHSQRDEQRRQLRRELLSEIYDDESVPLLEELVRDVSCYDVEDTLSVLVESTQGFGRASIRRVVTGFISQRFPEETIRWGQRIHLLQSKYVVDVLAEAFPLSQEGFDHILAVDWKTPDHRCEVWSAFIERAAKKQLPQWFVRRAGEDVATIEPFVQCDGFSARASRALQAIGEQCDYLPIVRSTWIQGFILKISETDLAGLFVPKAVDSAIAEHIGGRIDADRMLEVLSLAPCAKWCEQATSAHFAGMLISTPDRDSWQRAWMTLSILPQTLFRNIAGHQIIADFTRSFRAIWTDNVAQAWSRIIHRAQEELPHESSLRLTMQSTAFCFDHVRLPLGQVVCTAFPPLYEAVLSGRANHITDEMFGYFDWDKAKKLRKDVIDSYLASSWPPEELALIAFKCRVLRKVIHRLQRKRSGDEYIRKMSEGLGNIKTAEAQAVKVELSAILSDPDFFEPWD